MKKILPLLFTGCLFAPAVLSVLRADSLWTAPGSAERNQFADKRAGQKGDILTILVQETATSNSTARKQSDRSSSLDAAVKQFIFPPSVSGFGTKGGQLPGASMSGKNTFSGGGGVSNSQSLTASTSVIVTDVLPNNNLVIQGVRTVTFAGETQYAVLHGIVRPEDISTSNTVVSSSIANARIEFISEGSLTDAQKRGWMTTILDTVRPY